MKRNRIRTGEVIQSGIVMFTALCHETRSGHVLLRSHVTGRVFATRVDSEYITIKQSFL